MNTHIFPPVLLAAAVVGAQPAAPDAASAKADNPPAAPAAEKTEMQKWFESIDAQWQAAFKRDVTDVHEADINKLSLQYLNMIEDGMKKASSANDLTGALALRNEQKRFGDTQVFPERDEEGDAPAVKAIRAAIRVQLAKLEKDNAVRTKALHGKCDQWLAQAQAQLTKSQRLDDALLVQNKRDAFTAAWITPSVAAALETARPATSPAIAVKKPAAFQADFREHLNFLAGGRSSPKPIQLAPGEVLMTNATFKPPVEILVEAKTNSTDLRLGYAADQIIFNWSIIQDELRIDGGPAHKLHQKTAGLIPKNTYVTVRWVVTPRRQAIYVDGQLRFEHRGDYSGIDKPVSVFSRVPKPIITVKSIKVRQLPPGTE